MHLWRRRPDAPLQRQRLGPEDPDPAPDPLRRRLAATWTPRPPALLEAILATEISPELVPPDASGAIQSTEAIVGPYALQDFNLYYMTRYGFAPSKVAYLAWHAWARRARGRLARRHPRAAPPRLRASPRSATG